MEPTKSHGPAGNDFVPSMIVIEPRALGDLFDILRSDGYTLVGPTVRDQVIVYDEIHSTEDLPIGWTDQQEPGSYRLQKRDDQAYFGFAVGPHSWKKYLFPSSERLYQVSRDGKDLTITTDGAGATKLAFIAARSCELHAIAIQDKVFTGGVYSDPHYRARRENVFILAVNCTEPGKTCFCASMGTGPAVDPGFDLALTEIIDDTRHDFLVQIGSERGGEVLQQVRHRAATGDDERQRERLLDEASRRMGRSMDTAGLKELLSRNLENPRWDEVAQRCLSCANCTMVCPTCFCSTVEDVTDLSGDHAERWRKWDSCFTMDFSYIVGGSVRASTRSRYRQWLTHKLGTWHDQFGSSGCVGCGRCITWCPVGIDIVEEAAAIRRTDGDKVRRKRPA